jgi:hypothetical protein
MSRAIGPTHVSNSSLPCASVQIPASIGSASSCSTAKRGRLEGRCGPSPAGTITCGTKFLPDSAFDTMEPSGAIRAISFIGSSLCCTDIVAVTDGDAEIISRLNPTGTCGTRGEVVEPATCQAREHSNIPWFVSAPMPIAVANWLLTISICAIKFAIWLSATPSRLTSASIGTSTCTHFVMMLIFDSLRPSKVHTPPFCAHRSQGGSSRPMHFSLER